MPSGAGPSAATPGLQTTAQAAGRRCGTPESNRPKIARPPPSLGPPCTVPMGPTGPIGPSALIGPVRRSRAVTGSAASRSRIGSLPYSAIRSRKLRGEVPTSRVNWLVNVPRLA